MTSPAWTAAVSSLSRSSVAVPCSTNQVYSDRGCECRGVVEQDDGLAGAGHAEVHAYAVHLDPVMATRQPREQIAGHFCHSPASKGRVLALRPGASIVA